MAKIWLLKEKTIKKTRGISMNTSTSRTNSYQLYLTIIIALFLIVGVPWMYQEWKRPPDREITTVIEIVPSTQVTLPWAVTKGYYQAALSRDIRLDYGDWETYAQWRSELAGDFGGLVEMTTLFASAQFGSYTDMVLPTIGYIHELFSQKIMEETDDERRRALANNEIATLANVLELLDHQMRVYQLQAKQADADKAKFVIALGEAPCGEGVAAETCQGKIDDVYQTLAPHFSNLPGFYSTTLETRKGQRDWNAYHKAEIEALKALLETPINSLTSERYQAWVQALTSNKELVFGEAFEYTYPNDDQPEPMVIQGQNSEKPIRF